MVSTREEQALYLFLIKKIAPFGVYFDASCDHFLIELAQYELCAISRSTRCQYPALIKTVEPTRMA